ncbi:MAG: NAD(P)/FAD-dependent oxidoreductase [Deltaproteobacteria bacterium]|nr:NAD(P)/FAD-dependent oxidoreductase [Deltaproteobacteria bacterium]
MAIALRKAGITDFVILERDGAIGGTWRDNTYPGVACDVESHLYSYSFAPNPGWSRAYAPGPEINAYLQRVAREHGVLPHVELSAEVASVVRDDARRLWQITTTAGVRYTADIVVAATGGLCNPAWPDVPGMAQFRGTSLHSAQWRADAPLDGARVAVIGTGASAIQIVPALAPRVAQLTVYQRTPPWIIPRRDRAFGSVARAAFAKVPGLRRAYRASLYWRHELRAIAFTRDRRLLKLGERMARAHLARQVADPALRATLTPSYALGCKRVLISNDYYPALCRPNVELVPGAVRAVTATGVVGGDGALRPHDAIVYATGFAVHEYVSRIQLVGRGGVTIAAAWQDGAAAYLGASVPAFPNLFLLVGPNTGLGHNSMLLMIEAQVAYVTGAIQFLRTGVARTVEVRADTVARYDAELQARLATTVWDQGGCRSWYLDPGGRNSILWPGFVHEFVRRTRRFDPSAYVLDADAPRASAPRAAIR